MPEIQSVNIPSTSTPATPVPAPEVPVQPQPTQEQAQAKPQADDLEARLSKERARINAARMAKARQRAIEDKERRANEIIQAYERAKKDPMQALQELGWDYDKITEYKMNQGTPEALFKSTDQRIDEVREEYQREIQSLRQERQMAAQQEANDTINRWKASVADFVKTNEKDYQLIPKFKSEELVTDTAEEFFKVHGKMISTKEAADLVEQHLEEQFLSAMELPKIQEKIKQKFGNVRNEIKDQRTGATQPTITNDQVGRANVSGLSPASESERIQRALAALG